MISRRRYMGGVKKLPYDAEVEYIESVNRTQKIVTNFIPNTDDLTFTLKFEYIDFTSGNAWAGAWFHAYSGEQTGTYRILKYNRNKNEVRVNNGQLASGKALADHIPIVQNTLYDVVITPDYCIFNDVRYEKVDTFYGNVNTGPLQVFDNCLGKFYSLQVEKGGDVVIDLIPVRVGTVGYLYDKVSGKLFGNEGTGDFVVGPDKKENI